MLPKKQLELQHKMFKLIKESAIIPYINKKPKQIKTDPPITEQPADTFNQDSPWNVDPNNTIEMSSGRLLDDKNPIKELDKLKTDIYGFIAEDVAMIPAASDDLEYLAKVGLESPTPCSFIVKDANTGQFRGGLSISIDPTTGEKEVKAIDIDEDGDNIKKVLLKLAKTPFGSFLVKKKINVQVVKPDEEEEPDNDNYDEIPDTIEMDNDLDDEDELPSNLDSFNNSESE